MNWEAFGAIAEALGAAGVIVTLVYLVGQVRTSNRLLRSESTRVVTQMTNQTGLSIAENRELAELLFRGLGSPGELDGPDKGRFTWLVSCLVNSQHLLFTDADLGLTTHNSDQRAAWGTILNTPGGQWWWQRSRGAYTESFVEFVEREILTAEATE